MNLSGDNIRAKRPDTGEASTSACYFSKNVMKFLKELLRVLTELIQMWRNIKPTPDLVKNQRRVIAFKLINVICG